MFAVASYIVPLIGTLMYGPGGVDLRLLVERNPPIIVACYYLPCLVVVLRRPNISE